MHEKRPPGSSPRRCGIVGGGEEEDDVQGKPWETAGRQSYGN